MENELSIDEAIERGIISVSAPPVLIIIFTALISFFLDATLRLNFYLFFISTILAILIAWLLWSRRLMQWRIWAFSNVRNVHELKKRAEQKQLLWPKGSFFYSIEYKFGALNEQWKNLENKFDVKDIFIPDSNIPDETVITYSPEKNRWAILASIMFMIFGFYMIKENPNYYLLILGILIVVVAVIYLIKSMLNSKDKKPQIKINDKGIWILKPGSFIWSDIKNEEAIVETAGDNYHSYLVFQHAKGDEKINIDLFNIDTELLNKLLIYYRLKFENNIS